MTKLQMDPQQFERLLAQINQQTDSCEGKLGILFTSKGYFSAEQASRIIFAIPYPADKVRAIQMLEPRLIRMTCHEARDIISAVSVHNDKLIALDCIKRVLMDCDSRDGREYLLSAFPFEGDKLRALSIIHTVRSDVADKVPAGGHQGYAALGGLYTQCNPLVPHLYGDLDHQARMKAGGGKIDIPVGATPGVIPSMYTGHPSYAYPQGRTFSEDRQYPGSPTFPPSAAGITGAPTGAPPSGYYSGAPAPTGFPNLDNVH
ncbi:unnamed protein product [Owenia fusiformis]|uniref:Uncharacterized protein n=1 Tax=Owenia fusiformis TaxID=6347 RepID=A0A8J1XTL5_OWEFU|nr:unnamed protein product [Owenia fusiformis]